MLTPLIFGLWFSVMDNFDIENEAWSSIYDSNKALVEMLVPITFSMGIVMAVLKIMMSATNRGRD